jgi:NTP pyrophosphatase (non-canonical NTP hydrolase)
MQLNDYQNYAMEYRLPSATPEYAINNLVSEVGELFGHLAKATRDGEPPNFLSLVKKELGDIAWHLAAVADDFGFTLEEVAATNLNKLEARKQAGTIQGSGDER